ncbi:hypothetical protein CEV32_0850 [Brucella rhizosphaerae]|uniref:Uncharacterized protein n=1 Tax=Brucella rhizosphaerae TaxID=571254 RepID=A0A256FCS8_9HYPH|nr:hypothetical protein CEV32_0850 [Brucella rhizosphaerae]
MSKNAASVCDAQAGEGFMHRIVLVLENPKLLCGFIIRLAAF